MRHDFPDRMASEPSVPPKACPTCRSKELTTTSKAITSNTYWRCLTCGEVWNEQRLEAGNRYRPRYR
jgi:transposase-like protein